MSMFPVDSGSGTLFVVSPHSQHFDNVFLFEDFIDESMLDVDSPRTSAGEIPDQFFVTWRNLKWIRGQYIQEFLR